MANFRTSDGCNLYYEEAGSGQPLLLVHGWSQTLQFFMHQLSGLSNQYRVIALDLRGHGDSEKPEHGYRISTLARDLHDFVNGLGLESINLLGWSMGCSVIWSYLDLFGSSKVSKLILVDEPAWLITTAENDLGFFGLDGVLPFYYRVLNEQTEFAKWFVDIMVTTEMPAEEKEWMVKENLKLPALQGATLVFNHAMNDWRDVVKRITLPTLVVGGEKSHVAPKTQVWIHEQIPGSRLEIFEGRGHIMFYEEAEKFNKLMVEFIG